VDLDSLISALEELESKDADFKAWSQMRADKVLVIIIIYLLIMYITESSNLVRV
jgi:hypothetical protein